MSETTIGIIQDYYRALNEGDLPKLLALLTDDVVHEINLGKTEIGKEAFKKFMEHTTRCYRERIVEIVIFSNVLGDRAAAEFYVEGTYLKTDHHLPPANGQHYRMRTGVFFQIRGDQISRVTTYYNLNEWLLQITPK